MLSKVYFSYSVYAHPCEEQCYTMQKCYLIVSHRTVCTSLMFHKTLFCENSPTILHNVYLKLRTCATKID